MTRFLVEDWMMGCGLGLGLGDLGILLCEGEVYIDTINVG